MVDNTELNAGSGGDTIATDDIAGVKHQRVKIEVGADGSATDVSDANPMPVDDAGGSLTVDGTVTANLGATDNAVLDAIQAAVEVVDDAISGTEMQVDVITMPTTTVTGTVTANLGATDNAVLDGIEADTSVLADGVSGFSSVDLDQTEEEVKATAGKIYSLYVWNATAAPLWLQIFDNTAASVTVGTTAPTWNFPIPANADSDVAGVQMSFGSMGLTCSTGITVAVTTGSGTNSGAPGANEAGIFMTYI